MSSIEITKTMGYEVGQRDGKRVCRQTLTGPSKSRKFAVVTDVANLLNEAGVGGATIKAQLPLARLMGYLEVLGSAIEMAETLGVTFTVNQSTYGAESLGARLDIQQLRRNELA